MSVSGKNGLLRVAVVNKHLADGPGGSEVQCDLLARGLMERGSDPTYVAPHRAHRRVSEPIEGLPYPVERVPQWGRSIAKAVQATNADVVYWRFNKRGLRVAARRLQRAGIPVVFAVAHVNDVLPWAGKPLGGGKLRATVLAFALRMIGRWQHGGLRRVAAMTTNNEHLLPLLTAPVSAYVPNGMTDSAVDFDWPRPYCLWVAAIKAAKRPDAYVRLARELADHDTDFLMVGPVQENGHDDIVTGRNMPSNLHYLGVRSLEEVNGMFAAARLHVHTCLPEGFSNVFIQAWLQGCPSVSLGFDPGGLIRTERLGADAGDDWDQFVRGVRRLVTDDVERNAAGERARALASKTFSVDAMVDRVERVLMSVVRGSASGP